MAYENVDVQSAKNALNEIKNSIKYDNTNEILSSLPNNQIWNANAKENLKNSLNNLINEKYSILNTTLDRYISIIDNIEQYKLVQSEYNNIQNQVNSKNSDLKTYTSKDIAYKNNNQAYTKAASDNKTKQKSTQTDIYNLNQRLNELSNEMNRLQGIIDSLI